MRNFCSVHAEAGVLRSVSAKDAYGSTVYVARVNMNTGNYQMSKPCENCHRALVEAGVKAVVYTESIPEKNVSYREDYYYSNAAA